MLSVKPLYQSRQPEVDLSQMGQERDLDRPRLRDHLVELLGESGLADPDRVDDA